jgi:RNA polymerase sigma factor (sigma-70 family)
MTALSRVGLQTIKEAVMNGKVTTPSSFRSEDRLISAAQAGDLRAVAHLVTSYPPVRSLVVSLKRSVDPYGIASAELDSAARLAVLEALRGFDGRRGVKFTTYAYHFIRGAMLKEIYPHVERERESRGGTRRLRLVPLDARYEGDSETGDTFESELLRRDPEYGTEPGYAYVEDERAAAVHAFVSSLPNSQRAIVEAVFWDEQTHAEVAAQRGVSRPAITRALTRVCAHGEKDLAEHRLELAV